MSVAAEVPGGGGLPPGWHRLDRAVKEASTALTVWRRRALEAEEELARLRGTLESLASEQDRPDDAADELDRLRAENAALHSRMTQARKRVRTLLGRLGSLEAGR